MQSAKVSLSLDNSGGSPYDSMEATLRGNVVYVGSTDDLKKRIYFHKKRPISGFTKKHNVDQLVYFEAFDTAAEAV